MKLHSKRYNIDRQKHIYLIFISIMIITFILGFFFYFIISDSSKELVISTQTNFFNNIFNNNINYLNSFINSISSNYLYLILIFILSLSVIGFIFIIVLLLFKCFILGFSISSIIGTYGLKGILMSIIYIFPHQVLFLIVLLLMSYYGCRLCFLLFKHLFLRSIINFKIISKKYLKIFIISLIVGLICSLYEVFIVSFIMKMLI